MDLEVQPLLAEPDLAEWDLILILRCCSESSATYVYELLIWIDTSALYACIIQLDVDS
jgi:hypothetical protein